MPFDYGRSRLRAFIGKFPCETGALVSKARESRLLEVIGRWVGSVYAIFGGGEAKFGVIGCCI